MTLTGFQLPELSAYDPPVAGEGSLDPMGLAAISDRLADRLVPGLRARMQRVRFVTAMAVGAMACEDLADEFPADGVSTPSICFEWLVIEAFVRRLPRHQIPHGVPGSYKARSVVDGKQRLSAATYLKGPSVFGFNGVYKPFAVDAGIVGGDLEPGPLCGWLVREWEREQALPGFSDGVRSTSGGRLRVQIRDQVIASLRAGHCATKPASWLFGHLAAALPPESAGSRERQALRNLVTRAEHDTRAELAGQLVGIPGEFSEAELLEAVRPSCSPKLGSIIDAVTAYERFAALIDRAFRTLCAVSYSMGSQPLTPHHVATHEIIVRCTDEAPSRYTVAADQMAAIDADGGFGERLGEFAIPREAPEMVELLLQHHEQVQAGKAPTGKRPWFEPFRNGWVVRAPYGSAEQPDLGPRFVHPVRVQALRGFLEDTSP